MDQPAAIVFALSMAVWVADVRLAPHAAPPAPEPQVEIAGCETGFSASVPADADAELVTCGARVSR